MAQLSFRHGRLALALSAALIASAAVAPTIAPAATASKSGSTLSFTAAAGESNSAVISLAGGTYTVNDSTAPVSAGSGCTTVNPNRATCSAAGVTSISADGGNLNDVLWITAPTTATVSGGDGNDTVIGNAGNDILVGCAGDDSLIGGSGADLLFDGFFNCAGSGNDSFDGGVGADAMHGGPGTDTANYGGRTAPVHVIVDGAANDGEAGEGDNVQSDIENVTGGSAGDNITGSAPANVLRGEGGNDVVVGERPGSEAAQGGGNDLILGGTGADALAGGDGDNLIIGGDGDDVLYGGSGADSLDGGAGGDDMRAVDGVVDSINCGTELDTGVADEDDVVSPSCEEVSRSSFFPEDLGGLEGEFAGECLPTDAFAGDLGELGLGDLACAAGQSEACSSVRIARRSSLHGDEAGVRLKLAQGKGRCKGKLRLEALLGKAQKSEARKLRIGARLFSLRGGQSKRFDVTIKRAGRRALGIAEQLPVRVSVFTRGEATKAASAVIKLQALAR